jgi:hypothetical protein
MFAVGCIQAQTCHTGLCPTGVTSQDPRRQRAIVVPDKAERVFNFHRNTVQALAELVAAAGLDHPGQLGPQHFLRRGATDRVVSYAQQYETLDPGQLLADPQGAGRYGQAWSLAQSHSFARSDGGGGTGRQSPPA